MATALTIIKKAMQKAGILTINESPSAQESSDALDTLNDLLASWSNESLLIVSRVRESFPMTGAASYTIGTGGDFNTTRPIKIVEAHVRQGDIDYPLGIITDKAYERITFKTENNLPEFLNYSNGYPLGVIRPWPQGSAVYTLFITSEKPITEYATLATTVDLAPGWNRALIYNLAIELAGEYGVEPPPSVVNIAAKSLGNIKSAIAKARTMDAYPENVNSRNIYSGYYR